MTIIKFQGDGTPEWLLSLFNIRAINVALIKAEAAEDDEYEDLFIAYGNFEINTETNEITVLEDNSKYILAEVEPFEQVAQIDHSDWIDNEIEYFDSDIYYNEEFETAMQSDDLDLKRNFIGKILEQYNAGVLK